MDEEQYKRDLEAAGVDVPEAKAEPAEEPPADKPAAPAEEPKKEEAAPLQDEPKEQRKRSIYDEYKDKKSELKSEKELREQAERERDEFKQKLDALGEAKTPEEKKVAADDLEAFAQEIEADPAALRKMRDLFLKEVKVQSDETLQKDLDEFKKWKADNSTMLEKAAFETEFQTATPKLQELFPKASPEEMGAIKTELDKLSHTKEWHDKSLAYVAFEHKDQLTALISPKKRGMESSSRKPDAEAATFEFDPEADYTKMSLKEREVWETHYREMMKHEGLATGANGKKILI